MTTIPITGMIVSVEVESEAAPFGFASYADNAHGDPKTVIEPTGNRHSIYALSHNYPGNSSGGFPPGFVLSDEFNIGDIVEIYKSDAKSTSNVSVYDISNRNLMSHAGDDSVRMSCLATKLFSGTGNDWLVLVRYVN